MKRVLILNAVLLTIVVALVVQIVALWWRAEAEVEPVTARETKVQRLDVPEAARKPAPPDIAKLVADKDLFDQSRSPPLTASAGPVDVPAASVNLSLLGITVAGGVREALLKDAAQPKPLWLREGEEYGGMQLRRIDPTSVVMVTPGGDEVPLMISVEKGKAVPVPPTGPAGIQPPPARPTPHVAAPRPGATPGEDVKAKIERLREEARKRRQNRAQQKAH